MPDHSTFDEFVEAALAEDIEHMSAMLDGGFDVNAKNGMGETPFSFCCTKNKLSSAKFLVSRGAEVNTVDQNGGSPLDWAVCWSSPEFREWLDSVGGKRHDNSYEPWSWPPPENAG